MKAYAAEHIVFCPRRQVRAFSPLFLCVAVIGHPGISSAQFKGPGLHLQGQKIELTRWAAHHVYRQHGAPKTGQKPRHCMLMAFS
jgi:hypothetical protein